MGAFDKYVGCGCATKEEPVSGWFDSASDAAAQAADAGQSVWSRLTGSTVPAAAVPMAQAAAQAAAPFAQVAAPAAKEVAQAVAPATREVFAPATSFFEGRAALYVGGALAAGALAVALFRR